MTSRAQETTNGAAWHALDPDEVLSRFDSSQKGLSADAAAARLEEQGPNVIGQQQDAGPMQILWRQFKSAVILVMVAALLLSALATKWPEAIAIAAVLAVNVVIGFFSEWRAVRSMEALRRIGQGKTVVRRDGEEQIIDADTVVTGDILLLSPGASVSADARIVQGDGLRVNEAALTGESVPVAKDGAAVVQDAVLAERTGMVYKGTRVGDGTAEAVVVATGDRTEVGRITEMAKQAGGAALPLERQLDRLGRRMAGLVIGTGVLVAGAGLLAGQPMVLMIETAVALAVAAIPEGLPVVATIALARGMWLMARRSALINRLTAVETLGTTSVIFSDKTGTLTENKMTVVKVMKADGSQSAPDDTSGGDPALARVLTVGALCNNASLPNDGGQEERGDPMEVALLRAGRLAGLDRTTLLQEAPEVREVSFDRETMMMTTVHDTGEGFDFLVKGAPHAVMAACTRLVDAEGNESAFDASARQAWAERSGALAKEGLRLLAAADKRARDQDAAPYADLRFLGLIALRDPPRQDVHEAIGACRRAGIRVMMVTGDQPETAAAIAESVGIAGGESGLEARVIHGKELPPPDQATAEEQKRIYSSNIFARVSPEQKLDLVSLFQAHGDVVAMTGDGVNDAPALKQADIGIAMGRRGTDAAKEVADMVLKDDAFESISAAVRRGRIIFDNIRKSVMFMLCTNGAEILAVAIASIAAWPLPLRPLQILFLNVVTDVLPALALTVGEGSGREMDEPPRRRDEAIVNRPAWRDIAIYSGVISASVLGAMHIGMAYLGLDEMEAVTVSFLTLAFGKLWFVFNLRSVESSLFDNEITRNPWVWGAIGLSALLLLFAVYLPGLSTVLETRAIEADAWSLALLMSATPVAVGQGYIAARRRYRASLSKKP